MPFTVLVKGLTIGLLNGFLLSIASVVLFIYNLIFLNKLPKNVISPSTILITGANSGIGKALAERYAKQGKTLILVGRDEGRLKEVQQICEKKGATVVIKSVDVTDKDKMASFITSADNTYKIDLVIANAGVSPESLGFHPAEIQNYVYTMYDINVFGVLNTIVPVIPLFKERKQGQIAVVSSIAAYAPKTSAYASSKAAVTQLGLALRSDLSSSNIRVSVIVPPFVRTPMTDKNKFSMPFIMNADDFVAVVQQGLSKDDPVISPYFMYLATFFLHSIPPALSAILFKRSPAKRAKKD